jgi:hypothetical protein
MIFIRINVGSITHPTSDLPMNMTAAPLSHHPTSHDLNYMERLVLHALRQWVHNRARWSEIILEFNRACGPQIATRLCEALNELFHDIGIEARRHLRLYLPVCCQVSQDELCILNLIAAHQADAGPHAKALLRWLVPESAVGRIEQSTMLIAQTLYETGYALEHRTHPTGNQPIDGPGLLRVLH